MKRYSRPQMTLNLDCHRITPSHLHALRFLALKVAGIRLRGRNKTAQGLQESDRWNDWPKESKRRSAPAN
jgi:hypothetical protein